MTIGLGGRLVMSALKHGFFRRGFMLCDRCVLSGKCDVLFLAASALLRGKPMIGWFLR